MAQSNNNDIGELNNNTRQIKGHSVYTVTHGEVAFNWQHQQGCHITPEYQSIFVAIPLLCVSQARYLWKDYHDNQQTFITQMLASQGFVLHQSLWSVFFVWNLRCIIKHLCEYCPMRVQLHCNWDDRQMNYHSMFQSEIMQMWNL